MKLRRIPLGRPLPWLWLLLPKQVCFGANLSRRVSVWFKAWLPCLSGLEVIATGEILICAGYVSSDITGVDTCFKAELALSTFLLGFCGLRIPLAGEVLTSDGFAFAKVDCFTTCCT